MKEQQMIMDAVADDRHLSPVRRITGGRQRWRVMVETWQDTDAFHGRLLFQPDAGRHPGHESATLLHGGSREDVLALAYDLPEDHLRRVLHSLS